VTLRIPESAARQERPVAPFAEAAYPQHVTEIFRCSGHFTFALKTVFRLMFTAKQSTVELSTKYETFA
jgi:hypothetical protein